MSFAPNPNVLGYVGIKEKNPPDTYFRERDPLKNDVKLYDIGDLWQNTVSLEWFILQAKGKNLDESDPNFKQVEATWASFAPSVGTLHDLKGDDSLEVLPVSNTINLLGSKVGDEGAIRFTKGDDGQLLGKVQVDATTINIVNNELQASIPEFKWNLVNVDTTIVSGQGYISNAPGNINLTLPAICSVGSIAKITVLTGAASVIPGPGQTIHFGNHSTATGLQSSLLRDSVDLVCVVENLDWNVLDSIGNWNIL